jgi:hypothetical protein
MFIFSVFSSFYYFFLSTLVSILCCILTILLFFILLFLLYYLMFFSTIRFVYCFIYYFYISCISLQPYRSGAVSAASDPLHEQVQEPCHAMAWLRHVREL